MNLSAKELREEIEQLRKENDKLKYSGASLASMSAIARNHGEILALTSQLSEIATERMEQQTNQLIKLTWALVIVSAGLLVFGIVQTAIMLKQDANAHAQQIQAGQHQKGATP